MLMAYVFRLAARPDLIGSIIGFGMQGTTREAFRAGNGWCARFSLGWGGGEQNVRPHAGSGNRSPLLTNVSPFRGAINKAGGLSFKSLQRT